MAQTIMNWKDLARDGVTLLPSTAPEFSATAAALIGNTSGEVASVLGYSVILRNHTTLTIRGYALRWTFLVRNGNTANANYQIEQNFDPQQSGVEILPGTARVLSPFGIIHPTSLAVVSTTPRVPPGGLTQLAQYASIAVSLDAVAFDNGKVIGPQEGFAVNVWQSMNKALRDIGTATVEKARHGSHEDLVSWLTAQAGQEEAHDVGATTYDRLAGSSHWYYVYAKMAAQRLLDFSKESDGALLTEANRLSKIPVPTLTR